MTPAIGIALPPGSVRSNEYAPAPATRSPAVGYADHAVVLDGQTFVVDALGRRLLAERRRHNTVQFGQIVSGDRTDLESHDTPV